MRNHRMKHLFSDDQLSDVMELRKRRILDEIESLNPNYLLNANIDDLCEHFEKKHRFDMPVLKVDDVCCEQDEADIDVSNDFHRAIFDRSQPYYVKGTRITFVVPFVGDSSLFLYRPSAFTSVLPFGHVRDCELRIEIESADHNGEAIRSTFDRSLREVQQYLGFVAENVFQFNGSLTNQIRSILNKRREKLLKDSGLAASLGFPMRKREGVPETYSVPLARKSLPISLPKVTTEPFRPEPVLEMQGYEQILGTISNMALVLERSPHAFVDMKEEDIRTHFLIALNGQYEGQATGETFNSEGKTDILIRFQGRNIFIAECKFWTGPQGLTNTIDQLLGYLSWRDTKAAILVFNRNKNLTAVLDKITDAFKAHSSFKRKVDYSNETGFRFVLRQKNDPQKEIMTTILVFDIPTDTKEVSDATI